MSEFLKEIFTLRTVYIDKGRGRWAMRKRLHPFMRGVLSVIVIFLCGVIYFKSDSVKTNEAVAKINDVPEVKEVKTVKLIEPEPVKINLPPAAEPVAVSLHDRQVKPKIQEAKPVLIPINNNNKVKKETKTIKKTEIILPSEAKPGTDRIIAPKKNYGDKYRILIRKSNHTLSLLKGDELIKEYSVATGKNTGDKERVGDHRTPVGNFKIVSIENASSWSHDFRDGKGKIAGAYGPWFLRLDAKGWRGIGIHGTHDPDSRGTNATEGCIRLSNEDIAELKENYAYKNMPVEIREY